MPVVLKTRKERRELIDRAIAGTLSRDRPSISGTFVLGVLQEQIVPLLAATR